MRFSMYAKVPHKCIIDHLLWRFWNILKSCYMSISFYKVADYSVRISKIAKAEYLEILREIFISKKKVLINQYKDYISVFLYYATQKMKFSIKDFFSKCGQMHSFLRIFSHKLRVFLNQQSTTICYLRKRRFFLVSYRF